MCPLFTVRNSNKQSSGWVVCPVLAATLPRPASAQICQSFFISESANVGGKFWFKISWLTDSFDYPCLKKQQKLTGLDNHKKHKASLRARGLSSHSAPCCAEVSVSLTRSEPRRHTSCVHSFMTEFKSSFLTSETEVCTFSSFSGAFYHHRVHRNVESVSRQLLILHIKQTQRNINIYLESCLWLKSSICLCEAHWCKIKFYINEINFWPPQHSWSVSCLVLTSRCTLSF